MWPRVHHWWLAGSKVGDDGLSNRSNDISSKFLVLSAILLLESEPFILCHVGSSKIADLVLDVEHHFLWASIPLEGLLGLANVTSSNICGTIHGEGDTVRHLLSPSIGVQPWIIPSLFTSVDMDPSFLHLRVNLRPNVVLGIPYPSHASSDSSAQHAEHIDPLSTSSFPGL